MDMIWNLHTHTYRCGHADGSDREYVEAAIHAGYKTLGFADHVPIPFPAGYRSGCRMGVEETEGYVESILALREEYGDQINILVGYEAEYMPFLFVHTMQNLMRQKAWDFLILGQHFVANEFDGRGATHSSDDEQAFVLYTDRLINGIETGLYTYLAHPDMYRFTGASSIYEREVRRLCEAGKRLHIPMELNFTGLEEGRHYPREDFWEIAGEVGVAVVWGADSHDPSLVYRPRAMEMARELVEKYHLQYLPTPEIRDPKEAFRRYLTDL